MKNSHVESTHLVQVDDAILQPCGYDSADEVTTVVYTDHSTTIGRVRDLDGVGLSGRS